MLEKGHRKEQGKEKGNAGRRKKKGVQINTREKGTEYFKGPEPYLFRISIFKII
jgi:hypothetical protein